MLRAALVAVIGIAIVSFFATIPSVSDEGNIAFALVSYSAGLGAIGYPALLRRLNLPITRRSVFRGSWATAILLPLLLTGADACTSAGVVDGPSDFFLGYLFGVSVSSGLLVAFLLAGVYSAAYERIRNCPNCDELVSARAKICKHCKRDVIWTEAPPPRQQTA